MEFRWISLNFALFREKVPSNSVESTKWNDKTKHHFNIVLLFEWLFVILPNSHQNTLYDMDLSIITQLFIFRHPCVYCVWLRYIVREPSCWKYLSSVFLTRIRASTWAPLQYAIRRLIVRSHEVSKPRDWCLELSDHSGLWQAPRKHCCRGACQMSERCDNSNYQSRGFETSRDLTILNNWLSLKKCRVTGYNQSLHRRHMTDMAPRITGNSTVRLTNFQSSCKENL